MLEYLSLKEKVSLLAGQSYWKTTALPEQGIKPIKYSDGPNGVRGESIHASTKATCFPCAACVGASFNPSLARSMGEVIGAECTSKEVGLLLGPTVNLHRSPLGGRNFEAYSEDPILSGILGAAFVNGVQSRGVSACPKHFVGNECETERKISNTIVDEKTLRELYALPFQIILKESDPWAIMTSYNRVNGVSMSENKHILQDILREEWGFKGTIVSDFEGVYATVPSVLAGVALELPGPARFRGKHLLEAIKEGKIPESKIDNLVKDVIALSKKVGMNDAIRNEPDVEKTDSTATLVKNIATEGIVLLKNKDNILPLLPSKKQKIAIFGSPAASPIIHGGGSASLTASYVVSPLESLERTFGIENIKYHPGVPIFKKIPSASKSIMTTVSNGQLGLDCHWYNGWEFGENEIYHEILETTRTLVIESRIKELKAKHCSRMDFILHPRTTGTHTFGVTACGESVLRVDGKEIVRHAGFPDCRVEYVMQPGDFEVRGNVDVVAGQEYHVTIDTLSTTAPSPSPIFDITPQATSVGFYENLNTINSQEISTLAAECDVSFVFTANNKEYESESFDRSSMSLSPLQDQLITMVATSASKTVLVNATGSPITMPWIDDVDAILQCWYAGQEIGNALACVISGEVSPSAKLPVTFPKCIEDSPSFGNFPTDKNMEIRYAERGNMGYRARNQPTPLFPFGYGLSFTEFEFNDLALKRQSSAEPTDVIISTRITNTGSRSGREVMQIYIDGILKGFNKVFLNPGETQKVEVFLDKYAFSEWDTESGSWVVQARTYSIELRSDANKIVSLVTYNLMTSMSWNGL